MRLYRGSLLIVDGKITVGIITERDLVIRVIANNLPHTVPVSEVMSTPLITIDTDVTLKKAARIMVERRIRRLPVTENGGVAGILIASDVFRLLSNKTLAEDIWEYPCCRAPVASFVTLSLLSTSFDY